MRIGCWLIAVGLLSLSGCGTFASETTFINKPPRALAPRDQSSVRIFMASRPKRPFVDVAMLAVTQTHGLNEQGDALMLVELRQQAARLGCDGVIIGATSEHRGADASWILHWADPDTTVMRASCIMYLPDVDDGAEGSPVGERVAERRPGPDQAAK